ncbi:MAG: tRNA lysidine(34) synthetase TilS [Synergistaceae bacterium]|jgi:tRNA(Ile)-lysidine synthase|nr:tRNA lysidine(34) synthetase TilS [Synergistaceae bacterium]
MRPVSPDPTLEAKLKDALMSSGLKHGWWGSGGLLVALSGGGDSMATFELLRRFFPGRISAAHLEHGLRGEASEEDAAFVASYCERQGVKCFVRHARVDRDRLPGESPEMAGRRIRYEFFFDLLDQEGLEFVATGHNSDDSVETMLFNLFRGTGVRGLSGITPRRDRVIRPVIGISRRELRQFLTERGIPWREDETNAHDCYSRNKIRNHLLPWVRDNINESTEGALLGLSGECAETDAESEKKAESVLGWISRRRPPALASWDTRAARKISPRSLEAAVRAQGRMLGLPTLDRRRAGELCRLITLSGRWRFQWAGTTEVCGAREAIGWLDRSALRPPPGIAASLGLGQRVALDWGRWRIEAYLAENGGERARSGAMGARLPADAPCTVSVSGVPFTGPGFLRGIPWWSAPSTPMISWESEKRAAQWTPGAFADVHNADSCDIIIHVFCQ